MTNEIKADNSKNDPTKKWCGMKIAYVANIRIPTQKAHGLQVMKMCEALAFQGFSVELVVPDRRMKEDPFVYWGIKRNFTLIRLSGKDFFSLRWLPRSCAFVLGAVFFSMKAFSHLRTHHHDSLIYIRDREVGLLRLLLKNKFIFEIHFIPRFLWLYKKLLNRMDVLVTITHGLKGFLVAAGVSEKKILVLPDAVDLAPFEHIQNKSDLRKKFSLPQDKTIVLYAGQLYSWKGVDTLLDASTKLPDSYEIVIVGGTQSEISNLKSQISSNMRFVGHRPYHEIPQWLATADILVLPNSGRFLISRYYTSPMKLFEYMASGIPMVCSDLPSVREIVSEKETFFFEPDNASSLAKTLVCAIQNHTDALERARRARERVQQYTWSTRAASFRKALAEHA